MRAPSGLSPAFGEAKQSRRSHTAGPPQKSTPLSHSGVSTTHKAFQVKHNHLTKERSMLQANPHHQKLRRASPLPNSTETLVVLVFATARSAFLSPLKSALVTNQGLEPAPKLMLVGGVPK